MLRFERPSRPFFPFSLFLFFLFSPFLYFPSSIGPSQRGNRRDGGTGSGHPKQAVSVVGCEKKREKRKERKRPYRSGPRHTWQRIASFNQSGLSQTTAETTCSRTLCIGCRTARPTDLSDPAPAPLTVLQLLEALLRNTRVLFPFSLLSDLVISDHSDATLSHIASRTPFLPLFAHSHSGAARSPGWRIAQKTAPKGRSDRQRPSSQSFPKSPEWSLPPSHRPFPVRAPKQDHNHQTHDLHDLHPRPSPIVFLATSL